MSRGGRLRTDGRRGHLRAPPGLEALGLLGGGAFLPVHRGAFCLAIHAWDGPAETLLTLAPKKGVQLVMPRLGEPVEPAPVDRVTPWWRAVDTRQRSELPAELPTMTRPKSMPWPLD